MSVTPEEIARMRREVEETLALAREIERGAPAGAEAEPAAGTGGTGRAAGMGELHDWQKEAIARVQGRGLPELPAGLGKAGFAGWTHAEVIAYLLAQADAVPVPTAPPELEAEGPEREIGWCQQCGHLLEFCRCAEGPY